MRGRLYSDLMLDTRALGHFGTGLTGVKLTSS